MDGFSPRLLGEGSVTGAVSRNNRSITHVSHLEVKILPELSSFQRY